MFTGIIQARAHVVRIERGEHLHRLTVAFPPNFCADLQRGASIAIDGVCLTVTERPAPDHVCFDVMAATLARTTLAQLATQSEINAQTTPSDAPNIDPHSATAPLVPQTPSNEKATLGRGWGAGLRCEVNAERAARLDAEVGGHVVSGHVDCTARLVHIERTGPGRCLYTFAVAPEFAPYAFARGFVAVDGASLTIVEADRAAGRFSVSLIPETLAATTLGARAVGDALNVEWERTTVTVVDTLREAVGDALKNAVETSLKNTIENAANHALQNALRDFVLTPKG